MSLANNKITTMPHRNLPSGSIHTTHVEGLVIGSYHNTSRTKIRTTLQNG
jgi:hypothetical protein